MKTKLYFTEKLLDWHATVNKRKMPWKNESDPYKIWLSEIILQQTKVEQGTKYYLSFIKNFPSIQDLAKAPENQVLKLWEGLGYYSRARNLHVTAKHIVNELSGNFPNNYRDLLKLKGVGPYTAAAISSFAFKEVQAVVDGNVIRVLSRYLNISIPFDTSLGKKTFSQLANELISNKFPDKFNQAIMDFGASICKPQNPFCSDCFLQEKCSAFAQKKVGELPVKSKKTKVISRYFFSLHLENEKGLVIEQRKGNDVWKQLFQLPMFELNKPKSNIENEIREVCSNLFDIENPIIEDYSTEYVQKLSHRLMHVRFVKIG